MKLPIPIFYNDKIYREVEIVTPKGSVLADTKKIADKGNLFSAMRSFVIGCTESIDEVTDRVGIKSLVSKMPLKSLEAVAIAVILLYYPDDDGIEGVYTCPRCGEPKIAELLETDGITIDTRDYISNLVTNYYDEDITTFKVELASPVIIKNKVTEDIIFEIKEFELMFPTIENSINAYNKYGRSDEVRLQYQMFVEALVSVNDDIIDSKWKNAYGMFMFENIKNVKLDIGTITDKINSYGIDPTVEKICTSCGKVWRPQVNTSNFFVSGLHA